MWIYFSNILELQENESDFEIALERVAQVQATEKKRGERERHDVNIASAAIYWI